MYEDQFDFHSYCLRKMTLHAYIDMLRWEDSIRHHRFFFRAATQAVRTYLRLYDIPIEQAEAIANNEDGLTEEERKQAERKKKRAENKAKKAAEEKKAAEAAKGGAAKVSAKADPDPDGELLAATQDPLGEATKFIRQLQNFSPSKSRMSLFLLLLLLLLWDNNHLYVTFLVCYCFTNCYNCL